MTFAEAVKVLNEDGFVVYELKDMSGMESVDRFRVSAPNGNVQDFMKIPEVVELAERRLARAVTRRVLDAIAGQIGEIVARVEEKAEVDRLCGDEKEPIEHELRLTVADWRIIMEKLKGD
jgi:hypothetical protein